MVETADVIVEVLDARDPMGTRCKEVETAVLAASKRLVLVKAIFYVRPSDSFLGRNARVSVDFFITTFSLSLLIATLTQDLTPDCIYPKYTFPESFIPKIKRSDIYIYIYQLGAAAP